MFQSYALAIFTTAISTLMSWPFAVVLGIPIAFDVVFRKKRLVLFVRYLKKSNFAYLKRND